MRPSISLTGLQTTCSASAWICFTEPTITILPRLTIAASSSTVPCAASVALWMQLEFCDNRFYIAKLLPLLEETMNRRNLMPNLVAPVERATIAKPIKSNPHSACRSSISPSQSQWGWAGNIAKKSATESLNNLYPRYNHCECTNMWPTGETHPNQYYGYSYQYATNCKCW